MPKENYTFQNEEIADTAMLVINELSYIIDRDISPSEEENINTKPKLTLYSRTQVINLMVRANNVFMTANAPEIGTSNTDLEEQTRSAIASQESSQRKSKYKKFDLLEPLLNDFPLEETAKIKQDIGFFILLKSGFYALGEDFRRAKLLIDTCTDFGLLTREEIKHIEKHISKLIIQSAAASNYESLPGLLNKAAQFKLIPNPNSRQIQQLMEREFSTKLISPILEGRLPEARELFRIASNTLNERSSFNRGDFTRLIVMVLENFGNKYVEYEFNNYLYPITRFLDNLYNYGRGHDALISMKTYYNNIAIAIIEISEIFDMQPGSKLPES